MASSGTEPGTLAWAGSEGMPGRKRTRHAVGPGSRGRPRQHPRQVFRLRARRGPTFPTGMCRLHTRQWLTREGKAPAPCDPKSLESKGFRGLASSPVTAARPRRILTAFPILPPPGETNVSSDRAWEPLTFRHYHTFAPGSREIQRVARIALEGGEKSSGGCGLLVQHRALHTSRRAGRVAHAERIAPAHHRPAEGPVLAQGVHRHVEARASTLVTQILAFGL